MRWRFRKMLFTLPALLIIGMLPDQAAAGVSFDNWTLGFNSSDNHFDSGPTITTTAGTNSIGATFTNTVFNPGTPIAGSNSGCVGLCSNFYYTLALDFRIYSPHLYVVAGQDYAIQFDVSQNNFNSGADYHVQTPTVQFEYLSSNPALEGCGSCVITLVPNALGTFSLDFVPTISGSIAFGLAFQTGTNPNGAASSSVNSFTEQGSYSYSGFSINDLSAPTAAVPEPSTWGMLLLGFAGLGFIGYRRTRKMASRCW